MRLLLSFEDRYNAMPPVDKSVATCNQKSCLHICFHHTQSQAAGTDSEALEPHLAEGEPAMLRKEKELYLCLAHRRYAQALLEFDSHDAANQRLVGKASQGDELIVLAGNLVGYTSHLPMHSLQEHMPRHTLSNEVPK